MSIVSFELIFDYIKKFIINKANELGIEEQFYFYDSSGDAKQVPNEVIRVKISHGGGVQDASIPLNTYAGTINFEVMALEDYREELRNLFDSVVFELKSKTESIDNNYLQFTTEDFPEYDDKYTTLGDDFFNTRFQITYVTIEGLQISNDEHLFIDDVEVKYSNMNVSRNKELIAKAVKTTDTEFIANTSGMQIQVTGLLTNDAPLVKLKADLYKNTYFNSKYTITIKDKNGNEIYKDDMIAKDIVILNNYGSGISYQVVFYKGAVL